MLDDPSGHLAGIPNWVTNAAFDIWSVPTAENVVAYGVGIFVTQHTYNEAIDKLTKAGIDYRLFVEAPPFHSNMKKGNSRNNKDDVRILKTKLQKMGYRITRIDGDYNTELEDAIKNYQSTHRDLQGRRLEVDGRTGPLTWTSIFPPRSTYPNKLLPKQPDNTNNNHNPNTGNGSACNSTDVNILKNKVNATLANIKDKAYTTYNPFYNAGYSGQCTWYSWGRAKEKCGVSLSSTGPANKWLNQETAKPKSTNINNILVNSVAVFNKNGKCHVAFIEGIEYGANGNPIYVYYTESNWDRNGRYDAGIDGILKRKSFDAFKALQNYSLGGYIYCG